MFTSLGGTPLSPSRASGIPGPVSRISIGFNKSSNSNKSISPNTSERTDPRSVRTQTPGKKLLIQTPLKLSHSRNRSGLRFVTMHGAGDNDADNGEKLISDDDDDVNIGKNKKNRMKERRMNIDGGSGEDGSDDGKELGPRHSIQLRRRR